MRSRRLVRGSRSRAALSLALGLALVGVVALGLVTLSYAGSASASAGTTTPAGVPTTDITGASGVAIDTTPTSTATPSVGPVFPSDPSAPWMYQDKSNCLSCHGDPSLTGIMQQERPDGTSIALYVDPNQLSFSVHRFNDCTTCHGSKPHDAVSPLTKLSLAEKCGSCHQYEYNQYINSVHGAPQSSGNSDPATCTDCHSATSNPHNIVRVLDPSASTYPSNVAKTCAKCHDDPKLMGKYGIMEKVYDSYMKSFHGKAMSLSGASAALQRLNTATCVNCHGSHNISLVSDPKAPVAGMDNLLKTCQTCHPNAGPEFVKGFLGHKAANSDFLPQVYWGGKAFYIFSRVMLASGLLIVLTSVSLRVGPWATHKIKRRKKKDKPEPEPEPDQEQEQEEEE